MKVCADRVEEARRLRIAVEGLETENKKNDRTKNVFKLQGCRIKQLDDFR